MRSSRKSWAFTQPKRKPKTIKPCSPCARSGTVVRGTVEYRSPARFWPGEDMPRKSLDIRFTDYPFIRKKDYSLFPAPSEGGFGQSPE